MLLLPLLHAGNVHAIFCKKWSQVKKEGVLKRKLMPEVSGMAASIQYPGRIYWINDSGNKDVLYYGPVSGNPVKPIQLSETKFRDTEALTVTACGDTSCVIVGDVGNNFVRDRNPILYIFKEDDLAGDKAKPFRKLEFVYPDGPHDVEAMAALPNGDLLFITKELSLTDAAAPFLFLLEKAEWWNGNGSHKPKAKLLGRLPIRKWLPDKGFLGTAVTDAAVNADRGVLGILTYSALVETPLEKLEKFNQDGLFQRAMDFDTVPIKPLSQQEAMTYDVKEGRVIWSSEWFPPETPIYSTTCERTVF